MDKEIITWIDSNGTEFEIDDEVNYTLLLGAKGFHMPPINTIEEEVPFQAGSMLRLAKVGAREIDVPIVVRGQDEIEVRNNIRQLLRMFNPLKGDGRLQVTSYDGVQRELKCRYIGGLEIDESTGTYGNNWQKSILVLKAFDPFWYDSNTIVQTFKKDESPGLFFPILPLRVASSTVFADVEIDNTGDVEAWPEWIVTGPGENIVLRNLTTGDVTSITYTLEAGETITINTKPFVKTVTKQDGTNLFYTLSDSSSLWSLEEGSNSIQIEMADVTSESSVQLTYKNRYWGP